MMNDELGGYADPDGQLIVASGKWQVGGYAAALPGGVLTQERKSCKSDHLGR